MGAELFAFIQTTEAVRASNVLVLVIQQNSITDSPYLVHTKNSRFPILSHTSGRRGVVLL
jgi:hypothetical protein